MKTVLLIEDEGKSWHWLRDSLISKFPELEVQEASDGQEALNIAHVSCPDVIIMDISTVGDDGLPIAERLRDMCPPAKILVLGDSNSSAYGEAKDKSAVDYVLGKDISNAKRIDSTVRLILGEGEKTRDA